MKNQVLLIEQAKELLELDIDTSKASMFWYIKANPITKGWDKPELCMQEPLWPNPPNQEYPGYCQLFINEIPAYTKDKDYILIKTLNESTSVIFAHDPDSFKLVNGKTESIKNGYLKWEKTFVE